MVKSILRKEYLEKRNGLTEADINEFESKIIDLFPTIALQGIMHLLSYYPIPERKEFNTVICEEYLTLENPALEVYWPKMYEDDMRMEAIAKNKDTILVKNRFGIMEPAGDESIEPQLVDAVFVPLIAFDLKGFRVGYGKGFYDRYLARCAQDVVKLGFSYFEPVDSIGDIDQFDVPLNYCITPTRVYEF